METKVPKATDNLPRWTHALHENMPWCVTTQPCLPTERRCIACGVQTQTCLSSGSPAFMPLGRPRCAWVCYTCHGRMDDEQKRATMVRAYIEAGLL